MKIRYACFVSYAHGQFPLMKQFKYELVETLHSYLEPYFNIDNELFVDTEQLTGGDHIEQRVAQALWESVCMLVIYNPRYEEREFTRREFAAMEAIERIRAEYVTLPSRLIIPVIATKHPVSLPPQITERGFYLDFSGYTLATPTLKSNPEYVPQICRLAERIALQHYALSRVDIPPFDCNQFTLPAVTQPWRDTPGIDH